MQKIEKFFNKIINGINKQTKQTKMTTQMQKYLDRIAENFATAFKKGQFDCSSEITTDVNGYGLILENSQELTDYILSSISTKMEITLKELYKLQPHTYVWNIKQLDNGSIKAIFKIMNSDTRKEEKKNGATMVYHCSNCNKIGEGFQKCGGCKRLAYCSKECQKNDWKKHKTDCKKN